MPETTGRPPRWPARLAALAWLLVLSGCSFFEEHDGPPARPAAGAEAPDAVPRNEPRSRYGNPPSYVALGKRYHTLNSSRGFVERGIASWYGKKFHGRRTSSGETYDMYAMTAAHKTLPLPTYVSVTNLENRRQVVVKVNDRGPFHDNRIIDLSYGAAKKLGILDKGTGYVEIRAIDPSRPEPGPAPLTASADFVPVTLYLQVGAFALRANADRLGARLQRFAGELLQRSTAVVDGRTMYRVRLGPLADVAQADRLVQDLVEMGMEPPHIVLE